MKSFELGLMIKKAQELIDTPFPTEKAARKEVKNLQEEAASLFSMKNVYFAVGVVWTNQIGNYVFFPRFELDDPDPTEKFDRMIHAIKKGIPLPERLGFTAMTDKYHDSQKIEVLAVAEALYEDCDLSDPEMAEKFMDVFDIIKEYEASFLWFIEDQEALGQYVYSSYEFPDRDVHDSAVELWDTQDFNFEEYAKWILTTKDIIRETSYGYVSFPYGIPL